MRKNPKRNLMRPSPSTHNYTPLVSLIHLYLISPPNSKMGIMERSKSFIFRIS
jgi:hypothetical protein